MLSLRVTHLAVLCEIHLEDTFVVVKAQRAHRGENVLAVDGLALFVQALFGRLGCLRRTVSDRTESVRGLG
jgi:hypothetical protein